MLVVCLSAFAVALMMHLLDDDPAVKVENLSEGVILPESDVMQAALQQPVMLPENIISRAVPIHDSSFTVTSNTGRGWIIQYEVQSGDTLWTISEKYRLQYCTMLWSNSEETLSFLVPGTILNIMPTDGILHTVTDAITIRDLAAMYGVDAANIIYSPLNHTLLNDSPESILTPGMQIIIPGASREDCIPWQRPPWLENDDSHPEILKGCDYSNEFEGYPTNAPLKSGYRYVRGFTQSVHHGVDLAADEGTPVYAAGNGMVRFAGWQDDEGFGYVVVIDHGGSVSIYGHLSTVNVTCGQPVRARQLIGGVGSTGNSNGNHLHFEIRDAAMRAINPMFAVRKGF